MLTQKFFFIFTVLIILIISNNHEIFAEQEYCEWQIPEHLRSDILSPNNVPEITYDLVSSQYLDSKTECVFTTPINLENKILTFTFSIGSNDEYDINFSLIDIDGKEISSPSLMNWYGIPPNTNAVISLDPNDFKNKPKFALDQVKSFQININSNNINSIHFSEITVKEIINTVSFSNFDNLPIQSILPGFFSLILISFPSGYILVNYTKFYSRHDFFVKLPWILVFGFITYIIFAQIISFVWISIESILGFIIIEYIIFGAYILKNQRNLLKFKGFKNKKPELFFLTLLIISGIVSTTMIGITGWPVAGNDALGNSLITSLTMHHNQIYDGKSWLPIRDTPFESVNPYTHWEYYPKGFHAAASGIGFLTQTFPAVANSTIFAFLMFLIPLTLSSIVYRFSNSIFFSALMFLIIFWRPENTIAPAWFGGDLFWNQWFVGLFASVLGILLTISLFLVLIEFFQKEKSKQRLFLLLSFNFVALSFSYYPFLSMIILVGLISLVSYYVKSKIKIILLLGFLTVFISFYPIWGDFIFNEVFSDSLVVTSSPVKFFKYDALQPFNPEGFLFPFWISLLFGLIGSAFLVREKKYRYLSIVIITISLIHLLAISEYIFENHLSFNNNLRSLGMVFFLSIAFNLILIQKIFKKFSDYNSIKIVSRKIRINYLAAFVIALLIVSIYPSFDLMYDGVQLRINKPPGGNEKNLYFWLYENTNYNDLILNDPTQTGFHLVGLRAQSLINMHPDVGEISKTYNHNTGQFNPQTKSGKIVLDGNKMLKNPWNYEFINDKLKELEIKYLFVSERRNTHQYCTFGVVDSCYPDTQNWDWIKYSGNARIAMFENNPHLELIIRNGNSAIFKVI